MDVEPQAKESEPKTTILETIEKRLLIRVLAGRIADLNLSLLGLSEQITRKEIELAKLKEEKILGIGRMNEAQELKALMEEELS